MHRKLYWRAVHTRGIHVAIDLNQRSLDPYAAGRVHGTVMADGGRPGEQHLQRQKQSSSSYRHRDRYCRRRQEEAGRGTPVQKHFATRPALGLGDSAPRGFLVYGA